MIKKNSLIYIAGYKELVGSAVLKKLKNLNSSKIRYLGWKPKIYLSKGLKFVINSQSK